MQQKSFQATCNLTKKTRVRDLQPFMQQTLLKQRNMHFSKLLLLFLLVPALGFSQTPAQQQQLTTLTKNFISLYNSGDTAKLHAFINEVDTSAARAQKFLEQLGREQGAIGQVNIQRIRIVSPTETEALVQTPRFETWWRVMISTDSLQRFKEHHMGLVRVTAEVLSNKPLSQPVLGKEIEAFIARQAKYQPFSGTVLIQKAGKPVYAKAFGTGANSQPNTIQSQYGLASVGKLFTTMAILQLVEQGKISLDDSVGMLVPELKNKKLSPITITQLLSHTSGMGDFFEDPNYQKIMDSSQAALKQVANTEFVPEATAYMPFFEQDNLRFAPGIDWAYSNTGFELLSYILEKVTGTPYKTYVTKHVIDVAGMTHTELGSGAGGGRSTVEDLARFAAALKADRLLSAALTQRFFEHQVNEFYGWGSEHQKLAGETIVGHSGGFENVCNELNIYTKSGYTVVILSNTNPPFGHFLGDKIKTFLVPKQ
jgi:D-alanyl-D-alanine carboxypeptidase